MISVPICMLSDNSREGKCLDVSLPLFLHAVFDPNSMAGLNYPFIRKWEPWSNGRKRALSRLKRLN